MLALERLLCTGCLDPVDRYALGVMIFQLHSRGLCERSWGHAFIASAAAVGFDLRAGHRGPMLPRLNAFNDFTTEAVGPAEVSKSLCLLVERGTGAVCAPGLTSHMALSPLPCRG